jgi:hypothetical protein
MDAVQKLERLGVITRVSSHLFLFLLMVPPDQSIGTFSYRYSAQNNDFCRHVYRARSFCIY